MAVPPSYNDLALELSENNLGLEQLDRSPLGDVDQSHQLIVLELAQEFFPLTEIQKPILMRRFEVVLRDSSQSGNTGLNCGTDLRIGSWDGHHETEFVTEPFLLKRGWNFEVFGAVAKKCT